MSSASFNYEKVSLVEHEATSDDIEVKRCFFESDEIGQNEKASSYARKKLICAALMSVVFMVIEGIGGYFAGSLALLSDASHLITDSLTFLIGAFAVTWATKRPSKEMTYGYKKIEVLCAFVSIIGIWLLTAGILYFAVQRLFNLNSFEINSDGMLGVAILGFFVNIVMAWILHGGGACNVHHNHSHECNHSHRQPLRSNSDDEMKIIQIDNRNVATFESENINVQAAFLHVLGDFIQSIGVIIATVIIKLYPQAKVVDPLVTFLFSTIVLFTTVKIFKNSVRILLEGSPSNVSYDDLLKNLKDIPGVIFVHDLKIWSLSNDFHIMTAHIVIKDLQFYEMVLKESNKIAKAVSFTSTTIQIELQ